MAFSLLRLSNWTAGPSHCALSSSTNNIAYQYAIYTSATDSDLPNRKTPPVVVENDPCKDAKCEF